MEYRHNDRQSSTMFNPSSAMSRSFSLNMDRPGSSRGRSAHAQGSSATGSVSGKARVREVIDISRPISASPRPAKFVRKGGKKHHGFDSKDVPYPVNYDPKILDLDVLDHVFHMQSHNNVTWVDFKGGLPTRSLDLGCGLQTGTWVLEAAKQWKDCHFVGFDLMPIQPNLELLNQPELSRRIQWVHGNFLSGKLPFDDNSFDHIHVWRIGSGVPETHWDGLFEEIARVLQPGGAFESIEEDVLFPRLPRSYTIKTKQPRPSSAPYPRPSLTLSPPPSPIDDQPSACHAHALLESLYFGVFESRMVNIRPTSIIPHHLNIHFRNVLSTPPVDFPLPPPPVSRQQLRHVPSDCTARPNPRRSRGSMSSLSSLSSSSDLQQQKTPPTSNSSMSSLCPSTSCKVEPVPVLRPKSVTFGPFSQGPKGPMDVTLLPPSAVDLNDRSLALHLSAAYQRILACKEAMWDELCRRLRVRRAGGPDLLHAFGWDDEDVGGGGDDDSSDSGHGHGRGPHAVWGGTRELERARAQFEELTVRFERDMRYRTALADALQATLGWTKPAPAPLSKHERTREAELDKAIAAAAKAESAEAEQEQCSRSIKGFIGFKAGKW